MCRWIRRACESSSWHRRRHRCPHPRIDSPSAWSWWSKASSAEPSRAQILFECNQLLECVNACIDFWSRYGHQPFNRKLLHCKRAHRGSIDNSASHVGVAQIAGSCQISDKTASERVTRAGRIEYSFERIRWCEEDVPVMEKKCAMLALLYDDMPGAVRHDPARCLHQVCLFRQLTSLCVIERQQIDMREQFD